MDSTKTCDILNTIHQIKPKIKNLKIYPNPFSTSTVIEFENKSNQIHNLTIYDVTGKVVKQINNLVL